MALVDAGCTSLLRVQGFPAGLERVGPRTLHQILPGPSLIEVEGERDEPLFISALLHGNETTSFEVLQYLAARYAQRRPPRKLLIFVGNVAAAAEGRRLLPGQMDFNRIWADGRTAWHGLAEQVLGIARSSELFASIDIHNNTGRNPYYGCINALRPADLQLAAAFAPLGVFYLNPPTAQSIAFARLCPAITLECGRSGDAGGRDAAIHLVEWALRLQGFARQSPTQDQLRLFQTVGRVSVAADCTLSFAGEEAELCLAENFEEHNFSQLPAGSSFGQVRGSRLPLRVLDEHEHDLTADFLEQQDGTIRLRRPVTPAMITSDIQAIRQDCLCYFMQPVAGF
jgi:hypothetical protein